MKKNKNKHILIRLYRTSAKSHLNLTSELEEILYGLMLGDIHAERKNANSNTRIQFKQSIKNKAYIDHLYSLFQIYCGSAPKTNSSFDSRPNKNKNYTSIKF
jgi:LAGLIDADG DNA endonuclease family